MKYSIVLLLLLSILFFASASKSSKKPDPCVEEYNKKYEKAVANYTKKYTEIIKKTPKNAAAIIADLHNELHDTIGKLQKELKKCQKKDQKKDKKGSKKRDSKKGLLVLPEPKNIEKINLIGNDFQNKKSLNAFIVDESRLGIAHWCITSLYGYAYTKFVEMKDNIENLELLNLTRCMLLINSDHYTAHNVRKKILKKLNDWTLLKKEILLNDLILSKHPKSEETFVHRKFVINQMTSFFGNLSEKEKLDLLKHELFIAERCALIYPRNYYSWSYRKFILKIASNKNLMMDELNNLKKYLRRHVSDYSAYEYVQFILPNMEIECVIDWFYFNQFLIINYPGHESHWLFRRFLFDHFVERMNTITGDIKEVDASPYMDDDDIELYPYRFPSLENEITFAETCACDEERDEYENQVLYSLSYLVYITENALKNSSENKNDLLEKRNSYLKNLEDRDESTKKVNQRMSFKFKRGVTKELGEIKKISSESKKLESELYDVLKNVKVQYQDEQFSHITEVAKALRRNPEEELEELQNIYERLNNAVSSIVDVYYKGFNKSIKNFSDILQNLENAQSQIQLLKQDIGTCKELLTSRSDDLSQLYKTYLQNTEFLNILNKVEEIKGVPKILNEAIEKKEYLRAVKIIEDASEKLVQLQDIKALDDISNLLQERKKNLPEILVEEIQRHLYDHNENDENKISELIEATDLLGKVAESQNRILQLLRFKLRSIMEEHITEFGIQLEKEQLGWTFIQNRKQICYQAMAQERLMVDMLQQLFQKLISILKKQKFMIDQIGIRTSKEKKEISVSEWSSKTSDEGIIHIKVTKQVLGRIRDAIRIKLDDLRNSKNVDAIYFSSLEDLLYNVIEKDNQLRDTKVSNMMDVFVNIMKTHAMQITSVDGREKRILKMRQDFHSMLVDALSSPDTPRHLTIQHVWSTIQDELILILKDLLGVTTDELENAKKDNFEANMSGKIRFRFGSNIEFDQHIQEKSHIFSSLSKYFVFTPYNMIWMYRPVKEFIVEVVSIAEKEKNTLKEFMNNVVKQSLIPLVKLDYKRRLEDLLKQTDAFRPEIVTNDDTLMNVPVVHSSIALSLWIKELIQYAYAIPPNKTDFLDIIETILEGYLDKSNKVFTEIIDQKFCGECVLRNSNVAHLVETFSWNHTDEKNLEKIIKENIDDPLYRHARIEKSLIIDESSSYILLANLNESLEWIADQIKSISEKKEMKKTQNDPSVIMHETISSKKLDDYFNKYKALANKCLFALKIDIRVHCFYFLDSIKWANFDIQEETTEPEYFVKSFNNDLSRIEKCISKNLQPEKRNYLFKGIGNLVANMLIEYFPRMKSKKFTDQGILKMNRNIFAIQQCITNIVGTKDVDFQLVRKYYDLLTKTEKEIFQEITENEPIFTLPQYKAILMTETSKRSLNEKAVQVLVELWSSN